MTKQKSMDKGNIISGCLIGGAAGDALGYAVEFLDIDAIRRRFGEAGITEYSIDALEKKAVISDDTQMTLFTANGLIYGRTRAALRGISAEPYRYVHMAYEEWYRTQTEEYCPQDERDNAQRNKMWITELPQLYKRRAPGNTCLSALSSDAERDMDHPINNSKGCGGVMRVAPIGLDPAFRSQRDVIKQAAEVAAITHGHPLGFISAGIFAGIIWAIMVTGKKLSLEEIILFTIDTSKPVFAKYRDFDYQEKLIMKAMELAENGKQDLDNIAALGEGWVAEETLAIAIYCALRYQNDFSKGIIAAVNHNGDSDSTGAVTGNILGAWLGAGAIEDKWKEDLELITFIRIIAEDLGRGCPLTETEDDSAALVGKGFLVGKYDKQTWLSKYVHGHFIAIID